MEALNLHHYVTRPDLLPPLVLRAIEEVSDPAVKSEVFVAEIDRQFEQQGLLPSNPLTKALAYVRERHAGLRYSSATPTCLT